MKWLELKIPPVIIALLAFAIVLIGSKLDWLMFRSKGNIDVWVILPFVLGCIVAMLGVWEFRKARTTINPHAPNKASSLVTSGVYSITRNPMYLGIVLVILALTAYQGTLIGIFSVFFFMLYITRFQIQPEERVMQDKFGVQFEEYCHKVRRWF